MASVKDCEVWSVGIYAQSSGADYEWTSPMLDELVANYDRNNPPILRVDSTSDSFLQLLSDALDVPPALISGDETGSGAARLGTISKLKNVSGRLLADFENIPSEISTLIQNQNYSSTAAEFNLSGESPILTSIVLLQAVSPTVTKMKPVTTLYKQFASSNNLRHWQYKKTTKEVANMPQEHLRKIKQSLNAGLDIEIRKVKLRQGEGTPDDFEKQVETVASDQGISFNKSLGICALEYPSAFGSYKRQVQDHFDQLAAQESVYDDAKEYAAMLKHIQMTADKQFCTFNQALEMFKKEEPKQFAKFEVLHDEAVESKYSGGK